MNINGLFKEAARRNLLRISGCGALQEFMSGTEGGQRVARGGQRWLEVARGFSAMLVLHILTWKVVGIPELHLRSLRTCKFLPCKGIELRSI